MMSLRGKAVGEGERRRFEVGRGETRRRKLVLSPTTPLEITWAWWAEVTGRIEPASKIFQPMPATVATKLQPILAKLTFSQLSPHSNPRSLAPLLLSPRRTKRGKKERLSRLSGQNGPTSPPPQL